MGTVREAPYRKCRPVANLPRTQPGISGSEKRKNPLESEIRADASGTK